MLSIGEKMIFERLGNGISKDNIPKDLEIELNKAMAKTMETVRMKAKGKTCFYCGKKVDSFCNSHTIPRFCLESIGFNGNVIGPNSIFGLPSMGLPIGKETIGINSSGTFQMICRDCDSRIFQKYETPDNYQADCVPTQQMFAEIATKNYLKFIYKRKLEIELFKEQQRIMERRKIESYYLEQKQKAGLQVSELDLMTYKNDFLYAKKIAEKNDTGYYCFFYKLLDYVSPIAVQVPLVLAIDLEGNVINNIFNKDPQYVPADLHLCVFPLKEKTAVFLFIKEGETTYRKFYKQFKKKTLDEQLGIINYIIFLYSEDYFLAKGLDKRIDLSVFKEVAVKTPVLWSVKMICNAEVLSKEFSLLRWDTIPNLLSEKYKLR